MVGCGARCDEGEHDVLPVALNEQETGMPTSHAVSASQKFGVKTNERSAGSIYQIPNTEHMAYGLVRTLVYKCE